MEGGESVRVSESSLYLSFLGKYCVLFSRLNVFCVAAVFCGFLAPNPQQTTSPAIHPSLFLSPFLSPSLSPLSRSFTFHPLYREPPQLTLEPWTLEAMATTPPMEVWFPCCLLALSLFCVLFKTNEKKSKRVGGFCLTCSWIHDWRQ